MAAELLTCPKLARLTDSFGNSFHYGNAGDYWHPPFPIGQDSDYRTHVRRIRDMEVRPDDVIIASFPKAGLHWHHEILNMLQSKTSEYQTSRSMMTGFLDFVPMSVVDNLPSPRLLATHMPFRYFPRQALEKKAKIVHLDRNPKDVLVSLYNHLHAHVHPLHFPGTFHHFFRLSMDSGYYYGDLFDHLLEWQRGIEAHPEVDIYTSVFEDMKQDTIQGVLKLNEYLGTGCDQELCADIAKACTFAKLKPAKEAVMPEAMKAMFKEGSPNFYRKGQVGDWKNWFTVSMDEEFKEEYKKRMSAYKRQYKYVLE